MKIKTATALFILSACIIILASSIIYQTKNEVKTEYTNDKIQNSDIIQPESGILFTDVNTTYSDNQFKQATDNEDLIYENNREKIIFGNKETTSSDKNIPENKITLPQKSKYDRIEEKIPEDNNTLPSEKMNNNEIALPIVPVN